MACGLEEYLEYIARPVVQEASSETMSNLPWKRIVADTDLTPSSEKRAGVSTSYIQVLLSRCNLLCGAIQPSRGQLNRIETESDVGKEASALLSFVGAISQAGLTLLAPYLSELERLLSHGFSSAQCEVRVLCLQLISSFIQHTSPDLPSSEGSPWPLSIKFEGSLSSEMVLHLTQQTLVSSNDVEATVSTSILQY
jgi:hypothetical protein